MYASLPIGYSVLPKESYENLELILTKISFRCWTSRELGRLLQVSGVRPSACGILPLGVSRRRLRCLVLWFAWITGLHLPPAVAFCATVGGHQLVCL